MPEPWQTLAFLHAHPRDKDVRFVEKTHTYYVKGSSKGIVSTTGFVHAFFPHFDPVATITAMKKKSTWPSHPLYGMTDQQIIDMWAESGKEASGKGTNMHLAIEQFLNGAVNRIDPAVKETKEWLYFENFWKVVSTDLEPYRTEWEVWDDEYKLTGSIDMVFRRKSDGAFVIHDWKRSKEIKMENNWDTALGPLAHLPSCNYYHYTLQLNIYRWFLQKHYGLTIMELCIVILHPNNDDYKIYTLPILEKEVASMLDCRQRALSMSSKNPVEFPDTPCLFIEED
jgi:ATP-dependent exoDNAse (exonuclease V) beta subunit